MVELSSKYLKVISDLWKEHYNMKFVITKLRVSLFWTEIDLYEQGEVKNESKDSILAFARQSERMKAYDKNFERLLN
jgi:hypothetical protein